MWINAWLIWGCVLVVAFTYGFAIAFSHIPRITRRRPRSSKYDILYSANVLVGTGATVYSAFADDDVSKKLLVIFNFVFALLTASVVVFEGVEDVRKWRGRQYFENLENPPPPPNVFMENGEAVRSLWYVPKRRRYWFWGLWTSLKVQNRWRVVFCCLGIVFTIWEIIFRFHIAKSHMYCLSLLPVFIGLDSLVGRFYVWFYGSVRVRCLIETFGRGVRAGNGEFEFRSGDRNASDLTTAFLPNRGFPLQSACVRSSDSLLPHQVDPSVIHYLPNVAFHSSYDSYTVDLITNTRERVPFNFLVRTKYRRDEDWAIPQVDVILLSFSLVEINPFHALRYQIQHLRTHAPGTPIILVGDSDVRRSGNPSVDELLQLIRINEREARELVRTEGLDLYVGLNYRNAIPGDVLISALSLFCSSS